MDGDKFHPKLSTTYCAAHCALSFCPTVQSFHSNVTCTFCCCTIESMSLNLFRYGPPVYWSRDDAAGTWIPTTEFPDPASLPGSIAASAQEASEPFTPRMHIDSTPNEPDSKVGPSAPGSNCYHCRNESSLVLSNVLPVLVGVMYTSGGHVLPLVSRLTALLSLGME